MFDNLRVHIAKNYKNAKEMAQKTGLSEAFISTISRRDNLIINGKLYVFKCGIEEFYQKGVNDCIAGIQSSSDNEEYLKGYSSQYELEAKENAK